MTNLYLSHHVTFFLHKLPVTVTGKPKITTSHRLMFRLD